LFLVEETRVQKAIESLDDVDLSVEQREEVKKLLKSLNETKKNQTVQAAEQNIVVTEQTQPRKRSYKVMGGESTSLKRIRMDMTNERDEIESDLNFTKFEETLFQKQGGYSNAVRNLKTTTLIATPMKKTEDQLERLYEWKSYERRLEHALKMSKEVYDEACYTVLEITGGPEITQALLMLDRENKIDPKDKFVTAIQGLNEYFARGLSELTCIAKLEAMKQLSGESFSSFVTRVKKHATMMRDVYDTSDNDARIRIVLKNGAMLKEEISRLIIENDYTLEKIESIMSTMEEDRKAKATKAMTVEESIAYVHSRGRGSGRSFGMTRGYGFGGAGFGQYQGRGRGNFGERGYAKTNFRSPSSSTFRPYARPFSRGYSNRGHDDRSSQPKSSSKEEMVEYYRQQKKKELEQEAERDKEMICNVCEQQGHRAKNCPEVVQTIYFTGNEKVETGKVDEEN
jgi:hypothetical protein